MARILIIICFVLGASAAYTQEISVRVRQVSYSSTDPDLGGPATGTVTFNFELKSSAGDVLADGMGLSVLYNSTALVPTPTNTTLKIGPINTALWTQQVDNRAGNTITPVTYGTRVFDRRMIITFNQNSGVPDAVISGTTWTPVAQLTYYTLGSTNPQGGYITPEPGNILPQNELSSDGGLSTYAYLSPDFNTPLALGSGTLPVSLAKFDAQCSNRSTSIIWSTSQEVNSNYFEVQKSVDGFTWKSVSRVNAAGNSSSSKDYQITDAAGGAAQYRLMQVDRDGKVTYSSVVRTNCDGKNIYVTLYPVPARDVLNLQIGSDKTVKTNLQVFDTKGRMVINMPVSLINGTNNFTIQVQQLPAGEYILKGTDASLEISKRFTVIR